MAARRRRAVPQLGRRAPAAGPTTNALAETVTSATESVRGAAAEAVRAVKPRLRGWIHASVAPLALSACLVLTVLAPGTVLRWACAVYLLCSLLLFASSGIYHLSNGYVPARVSGALRRLDHSTIYLLIAGTYTPLSLALMERGTATLVLGIVWGGALAGITCALAWPGAPRWLATSFYVLLGWVVVWFLPQLWGTGHHAVVWLLFAGGVIYTVGAVVYARRRPDPAPRWFGFHEVFHACTVAAWVCHCTACYLAVLG